MYKRIVYLGKTSGLLIMLSLFAMACSKSDSAPELAGTLEITVPEDPVIVGEEVVFEITENGKAVSGAQVLINGTPISGNKHVFDKTGPHKIVAKKENYKDSETLEIRVKRIETNVYIVGRIGRKGTLWKNGKAQAVPNAGDASRAISVYVKDGQVLISGQGDLDGKGDARVWINGKPRSLTDDDAKAESVFAYGKDVYTAGTITNSRDYTPTLWKNNEVQTLPYDGENAYAYSVFVFESDVYVAGFGKMRNKKEYEAIVWRNGKEQILKHDGRSTRAISMFVDDGDVYAAGSSELSGNWEALVWKNGVAQTLTDGTKRSNAASIVVHNGDVYVTGFESQGTYDAPILWKNGKAQVLEHGANDAWGYDVFVIGKDVYVVGEMYVGGKSTAVLWKNGKQEILSDTTEDAYANAIFVEETLVE